MATKKQSTTAKTKKSGTKKSTKSTKSAAANKKTTISTSVTSSEVTSAPAIVSKTKKTADDVYKKLNGWNWIFTLLYASAAAAIVTQGNTVTRSITTTYLTEDPIAGGDTTVLVSAARSVLDLNLAYLVAAVLGVAALKHILAATVLRDRYEADLKRETNRSRWLGHGIGDGLAIAGVGLIVGISDVSTLFAIFAFILIATTAVISAHKHIGSSHKTGRMTKWIGALLVLAPWLIIAKTLYAAREFGSGTTPTDYMYILAGGTFALYMAYMMVERTRMKQKNVSSDYTNVEWAYMLIGFALKAVFAVVIFNYLLK